MNHCFKRCATQFFLTAAMAALLLVAHPPTVAAPGAHGPNGEHLDSPAGRPATSARPRVEASSEAFELVAELRAGELAIMVDRYESNEPVLGARLEVERGDLKAVAAFRAEQGDYAVTDAAMLKALAAPGEHGLVFTLVAGKDSDLLDATLVTAAGGAAVANAAKNQPGHAHGNQDHGHGHGPEDGQARAHVHAHDFETAAWIGAGVVALGVIGGVAWRRQRRRSDGPLQGGL